MQRVQNGVHFQYNSQSGLIKFFNGSEILLKDLFSYPSDPNFDELGSLEITDAFIDEANQVTVKAKQIVRSRIRHKLSDNGLVPKLLMTCNPAKNWTYSEFFKPHREGNLKQDKQFIQSLVTDNPNIDPSYIENLKQLDNISKQRLLFGNWDYDDSHNSLCTYDKICDIFQNDHVQPGYKYISADLAMQGRDKFIGGHWDGMIGYVDIDESSATGKQIELQLKELMNKHQVPASNVVADADGLGNYIESYIVNIKAFRGGSRAFSHEFYNLKSECAFKLAEMINTAQIKIICSYEQQELIKEELSACLKRMGIDKDEQKKRIISKEEMKETLNRSPDYFDWMLMRMYFEIYQTELETEWT